MNRFTGEVAVPTTNITSSSHHLIFAHVLTCLNSSVVVLEELAGLESATKANFPLSFSCLRCVIMCFLRDSNQLCRSLSQRMFEGGTERGLLFSEKECAVYLLVS